MRIQERSLTWNIILLPYSQKKQPISSLQRHNKEARPEITDPKLKRRNETHSNRCHIIPFLTPPFLTHRHQHPKPSSNERFSLFPSLQKCFRNRRSPQQVQLHLPHFIFRQFHPLFSGLIFINPFILPILAQSSRPSFQSCGRIGVFVLCS